MHKNLTAVVLASLLGATSPFALAQDSSDGMSMPDGQTSPELGAVPDRSTNPYIPQTWYDPRFNSPFWPNGTRQIGPNSPAYQEDYAQ